MLCDTWTARRKHRKVDIPTRRLGFTWMGFKERKTKWEGSQTEIRKGHCTGSCAQTLEEKESQRLNGNCWGVSALVGGSHRIKLDGGTTNMTEISPCCKTLQIHGNFTRELEILHTELLAGGCMHVISGTVQAQGKTSF